MTYSCRRFGSLVWLCSQGCCWGMQGRLGRRNRTARAAEVAAEQERKAQALTPYHPGWFERKLLEIEQAGGFGAARGLVVASGDIKRGTGPSLGPAYGHVFKSGVVFTAKAVYSITNAKVAQVSLQTPHFFKRRLTIGTRVRWQDVPNVVFHGLAPGVEPVRAWYSETQSELSANAAFRPVRLLRFGAGRACSASTPASQTRPACRASASSPECQASAPIRIISIASPLPPSIRAMPTATPVMAACSARRFYDFRQQNTGPYSFRRLDGVAEQYLPILSGNWVFYFGVRASTTQTDAGQSCAGTLLMPDLGGHYLRGYGTDRFVDKHSITVRPLRVLGGDV